MHNFLLLISIILAGLVTCNWSWHFDRNQHELHEQFKAHKIDSLELTDRCGPKTVHKSYSLRGALTQYFNGLNSILRKFTGIFNHDHLKHRARINWITNFPLTDPVMEIICYSPLRSIHLQFQILLEVRQIFVIYVFGGSTL